MIDRNFIRKVWQWLTCKQDVLILDDEHLKDLTFDELETRFPNILDGVPNGATEGEPSEGGDKHNDSNVPTAKDTDLATDRPRISVTLDRIYSAICGHGPDPSRVFPKEYELLCAIARTRQEGILQGPLGKQTGQNKHSVPRRTDNLHSKGYIVKRTVLAAGQKTCRLILRRFAESSNSNSTTQPSALPLKELALQVFSALKASAFTSQDDLAQILSMKDPAQRRVLGQVVTQLIRKKCLKKVKAALGPSSDASDLKICIQILREPVDSDWQRQEGDIIDFSVSVQHTVAIVKRQIEDLGEESAEVDENLETNDDSDILDNPLVPDRPQWNPERQLPNVLQNLAFNAGDTGITNTLTRRAITGLTVRRPIESALVRLSHSSMDTQPIATRNLSLVRSMEARDSASQFIHRTAPSFQAMVRQGQAEWSAVNVSSGVVKELQLSSGHDLISAAERDEFGFVKRTSPGGQVHNGAVELSTLVQKAAAASLTVRNHEAMLVEDATGNLKLSTMMEDQRHRQSPSSMPLHRKQGPQTGHGRPRKFTRGTEKFWQDIMLAKKLLDDPKYSKQMGRLGATNDSECIKWHRRRPKNFDDIIIRTLEQELPLPTPLDVNSAWANKMVAFLNRIQPGLYATPTGVTNIFRGRPTCILAFRSDRLSKLDLFDRQKTATVLFLTSSAAHVHRVFRYNEWIHKWKEGQRLHQALQKNRTSDAASVVAPQRRSTSSSSTPNLGPAPPRGLFYEQGSTLMLRQSKIKPTKRKRGKRAITEVADDETDATASEAELPPRKLTRVGIISNGSAAKAVGSPTVTQSAPLSAATTPKPARSARIRKPTQKSMETSQALRKEQTLAEISNKDDFSASKSCDTVIAQRLEALSYIHSSDENDADREHGREDYSHHLNSLVASNPFQDVAAIPEASINTLARQSSRQDNTRATIEPSRNKHGRKEHQSIPAPGTETDRDRFNSNVRNLPKTHLPISSSGTLHTVSSHDDSSQADFDRRELSSSKNADKPETPEEQQLLGNLAFSSLPLPIPDNQMSADDAHASPNTLPVFSSIRIDGPLSTTVPQKVSDGKSNKATGTKAKPRGTSQSSPGKASSNTEQYKASNAPPGSELAKPKFLKGRDAIQYYKNFLMELVYLCGGVVPNSPSLLKRALKTKCVEANVESDIHIKLLKSQMNDLIKRQKVKIMHFAFQRNGFNHTKAIMALPHIQPTDDQFIGMQKRMSSLPVEEDYIPPELDAEIARKPSEIIRKDSDTKFNLGIHDPELPKKRSTRGRTRLPSVSSTTSVNEALHSSKSTAKSLNVGFLTLKVPNIGQIRSSADFTSHYFSLPTQPSLIFNPDANFAHSETALRLPASEHNNDAKTPCDTSNQGSQGKIQWHVPKKIALPKSLRGILSQQQRRSNLQNGTISTASTANTFTHTVDLVATWELQHWDDLKKPEPGIWNFINHLIPQKDFVPTFHPGELELRQVTFVADCDDSSLLLERETLLLETGSWDVFAALYQKARMKQPKMDKTAGRRKRKHQEIDERDADDSNFTDVEGEASDPPEFHVETRSTRKQRQRKAGTRDDKRRKQRVRHEPRGVGMRHLPKEAARRISLAFVVVKVLTGGLDKHLDFSLVNRLVSNETETLLRERWKVLSTRYNNDIDACIKDMQIKYLDALADDKVPSVDYSNIDNSDWEGILEWAMANITTDSEDVALEIPPSREEFLALNKVEIIEPKPIRNLFNQTLNYTMGSKEEAWCSAVTGTRSKQSHLPDGGLIGPIFMVEEDELDLDLARARSWSLASVLTSQRAFDPAKTQQKLLKLATNEQACEVLLATTMKKMQSDKIIVKQDSGEVFTTADGSSYSGTHGWKISTKWFDKFEMNRNISSSMLKSAAKFKIGVLDQTFALGEVIVLDKSPNIEDGAILAIFNLLHMGMLRIKPGSDIPASRYGLDWEDQGYKTRCMDRDILSFSTILEATSQYVVGNPISEQYKSQAVPKGGVDQQDGMGLIPAWFDINHNFQPHIWEMILGGVIGVISVRPGISDIEIGRTLSWALSLHDINLILHFLWDCNLIKSTCAGWDTEEWWWLVIGPANNDEQGVQWKL